MTPSMASRCATAGAATAWSSTPSGATGPTTAARSPRARRRWMATTSATACGTCPSAASRRSETDHAPDPAPARTADDHVPAGPRRGRLPDGAPPRPIPAPADHAAPPLARHASRRRRRPHDDAAQHRQAPGRHDTLHGRHEEFTADLPCNQVPRAVAESLLPLVAAPVRAALETLLPALADASPVSLNPALWAQLLHSPAPPAYSPLLDLCRALADALSPAQQGGSGAPAFLLELERLFERFVTRAVVESP